VEKDVVEAKTKYAEMKRRLEGVEIDYEKLEREILEMLEGKAQTEGT